MKKKLQSLKTSKITLFALAAGGCIPAISWAADTNLTFRADLSLKETYDSNVYLQEVEPDPAITNTARPHQDSFVTSVMPKLGLEYRFCDPFKAAVSYSPEAVRYHAEPSEDYVAHRGILNFAGTVDPVYWEQANSVTWIDGNTLGLTFGGPGGAPAIGGIPIRDRRAGLIIRNSFRAFHPIRNWFFRPMAASYIHDFRTEPRTTPGYQNYVDRNDVTGGLDVGFKAFKDAYVVAGYRYGHQEEPPLPGQTAHYSNVYHRFLIGFEGTVTDWLKGTVAFGPDYRDFDHHTPPGFDDHHTKLFLDISAAITLSAKDTLTLTMRQYEQPAFGTPSVYEDITFDATLKHQCHKRLALAAGFRAYAGDWLAPVAREDWIFTPSVAATYSFDKHLTGELAYSYDWVDSRVPDTAGREFTRHLATLGLKYSF